MKLDYESKKWAKEVVRFNKFKKEIGGKYNKFEMMKLQEFTRTNQKDYLELYCVLNAEYEARARYCYLEDVDNKECIKYTYLSGIALVLTKKMYNQGMRTEYNFVVEDSIKEMDYALYQLIAVNEIDRPYLQQIDDNHLISLMFQGKYDQAKKILEDIPDKVDESKEIYYIKPVFLKQIYLAIINRDEKAFNEELAKRIKKYRKNMVGYSTIIDIVSVALIKMAKQVGIECRVDVIEIPKIFFDDFYQVDKTKVKLPFYDEFLKLGIV